MTLLSLLLQRIANLKLRAKELATNYKTSHFSKLVAQTQKHKLELRFPRTYKIRYIHKKLAKDAKLNRKTLLPSIEYVQTNTN
jgi:hypothetical protein